MYELSVTCSSDWQEFQDSQYSDMTFSLPFDAGFEKGRMCMVSVAKRSKEESGPNA